MENAQRSCILYVICYKEGPFVLPGHPASLAPEISTALHPKSQIKTLKIHPSLRSYPAGWPNLQTAIWSSY